eukprot:scaffold1044_cov332-Prasinococcus_capsulatus_cf.AAC.3
MQAATATSWRPVRTLDLSSEAFDTPTCILGARCFCPRERTTTLHVGLEDGGHSAHGGDDAALPAL